LRLAAFFVKGIPKRRAESLMVWVEFLISAAVITIASMQLAKYGDVIGLRTKLGGAFAGTLLLASGHVSSRIDHDTISAVRSGIPSWLPATSSAATCSTSCCSRFWTCITTAGASPARMPKNTRFPAVWQF
jgi:hypothetical protein